MGIGVEIQMLTPVYLMMLHQRIYYTHYQRTDAFHYVAVDVSSDLSVDQMSHYIRYRKMGAHHHVAADV
jgi:hypothetical protein